MQRSKVEIRVCAVTIQQVKEAVLDLIKYQHDNDEPVDASLSEGDDPVELAVQCAVDNESKA